MWPVLFEYGQGAVTTYSFLMGLAYLVALAVWIREGRKFGLGTEKMINLSIGAMIFSLIGARLLFIITAWSDFERGTYRIWALWEGGVVFYGGLIFGLGFMILAFHRNKIELGRGFNSMAPGLAFGHAIGRIGCFMNGCCYGSHCDLPWAVTYTNPLTIAPKNYPVHPVQLYEAAALTALGFLLLKNNSQTLKNRSKLPSWQLYFLIYPVLRFILEFFRDDPERGAWAGLSTSQWISILLFFVCLFLAFYQAKRLNKRHGKSLKNRD